MTLDYLKTIMRIDGTEDDLYLTDLLETSQIYVDSCVGEEYKTDVKAVKLSELLQQKLINDMYTNRGTEIPSNTKQDRIVTSILDKLSNCIEVL